MAQDGWHLSHSFGDSGDGSAEGEWPFRVCLFVWEGYRVLSAVSVIEHILVLSFRIGLTGLFIP